MVAARGRRHADRRAFGLIHINSWRLVALTWVLGTVLAWVYMEDRYRNLFAAGFVHGVLGPCRRWLFGRDSAFHISARVGPESALATADPGILTVTGFVMAVFVLALVLAAR